LHTDPFFKERQTQVPAFAEAQRADVPRKWAWLDRELADGRPFIAGDAFSTADIIGMVASWLGDVFAMAIPDGLDHVGAWDRRMRARPSWNA
ncbi:glutathione S-transferase C-terminal domain-containing protein, partial [Rhizobiaceae sp. 2RAB30]